MLTQQDAIKARIDDTAIYRPNDRVCCKESGDAQESFKIPIVSQWKQNIIFGYVHPQ
jgi:hypothetical protein